MPKKISHLTIEHLYYLLENNCFLTFKADGVFSTREENDGIIEFEKLDDGREFVFDYVTESNKDNNVLDRINEYSDKNNFDKISFDELTLDNFDEYIDKYINFYQTFTGLIIPKFYFKISNKDKVKILIKLTNYFIDICFPTDGWVVVPTDVKYTAKIKPLNQMTIDLKYYNGNFFDSNRNVHIVNSSLSLKNKSIYRCYFDDNSWKAREERKDKKYPNSKYVVDLVQNQINFKLNIINLIDITKYKPYYGNNKYDSKFYDFFNHINLHTLKYLQDCRDNNVLDVGCGKNSSVQMWKEIKPKKVTGIDIDPICIFKSITNTNSNSYIWMNFNKKWNIIEQKEYFGNVWEISQLFKMHNLYTKFDCIVFNFSIHYSENYKNLIDNINNFSKKGTILKFNWINYDNINCFDIKIIDNSVSLKLPWKNEIHNEPYFRYNLLSSELKNNNWTLVEQNKIKDFHSEFINWQENINYDTWIYN